MRTVIAITLAGLCLAAAACSKPTQEKTAQDLKAVGSDTADAAKTVANAPAAKSLGSDLEQGAEEAAEKTREAAGKAGEKLKAGAKAAGDKTGDALSAAQNAASKH